MAFNAPPRHYRERTPTCRGESPSATASLRAPWSPFRRHSLEAPYFSVLCRYEADLYGTDGLSERMGRLLHPISSSPAVSRTVSGVSDTADRERYSQTPDQKVRRSAGGSFATDFSLLCLAFDIRE